MNASRKAVLIAVVASMAMSSGALAAPSSTNHDATSATLRDAAGDVLLSDVSPIYAGRELTSRIVDFADPATPDRFHFQPGHKRFVRIQHSSIDGGTPVACEFTFIVFTTRTLPNWYQDLASGGTTPTDAFFICNEAAPGPTGRRFRVNYPDFPAECAQIRRVDLVTWEFTAPADCAATVITVVKEKGQTSSTEVTGTSAPMQITAMVP
jgi:hypothetical protein